MIEVFFAYFGQEVGSAAHIGICGQPSGPLMVGQRTIDPQFIGQWLGHFLPPTVAARIFKKGLPKGRKS